MSRHFLSSNTRRFGQRAALGMLGAGVAATAVAAAPGVAFADYGPGAQHQVEISASLPANFFGPGTGGGIWLWIELSGLPTGGTGDYQGADCLHHTPIGPTGAGADSGTVAWSDTSGTITITGVTIGGTTPVTITVPDAGHENLPISQVFSGLGPVPGSAMVEVAP